MEISNWIQIFISLLMILFIVVSIISEIKSSYRTKKLLEYIEKQYPEFKDSHDK